MTWMRDGDANSGPNPAPHQTNFFRHQLAVDGLTMSVCMECSILIAVSENLSTIATAEWKHDQGRHQS